MRGSDSGGIGVCGLAAQELSGLWVMDLACTAQWKQDSGLGSCLRLGLSIFARAAQAVRLSCPHGNSRR